MDSVVSAIKRSKVSLFCLAITYFTSASIITCVQFVLYCTVRFFSKNLYRKLNWYLTYSITCQDVYFAEWWSNSKVILYVDQKDFEKYFGKEHGLLIMNHASEIDFIWCLVILEKFRILGNAKFYTKKSIKYLPPVGGHLIFNESVFLERNFEKDKKNIHRQVAVLCDYSEPMCLILCPEGTRFSEEKHKASLEFSRKNNQPELKHHLLPRTKGFIASLPAMRGKVPALYDCLIIEEDSLVKSTFRHILMGKPITVHIYLRRIPLEEIPESDEEADKYLKNLFVTKDKMKEGFLKHGDFFKYTEDLPRYKPLVIERRLYSLIITVIWSFIVMISLVGFLTKLLFTNQLVYFSFAIGILGTFFYWMHSTLVMMDLKKTSKYGIKSKNGN